MKILAIDVGTGTEDILLYDSEKEIENSMKLVIPSPHLTIGQKISECENDIYFDGVIMGGGKIKDRCLEHMEKGYKVAVCEQVEDPKSAQGLVRREVVRVVTPGTVTDSTLLNESKNNYLAAICYGRFGIGLAFLDISTGEISATYITTEQESVRLENELSAMAPSEVIIILSNTESVREFAT